MIAVKKGTTGWRQAAALAVDEVEFVGDFIYASDGNTPRMVWDAGLNNVRAMTQAEIDALPAANLQKLYTQAKALLTSDDAVSKKEKGVLLVILDEFNAHAAKMNSIMTACDNAATFAAFKAAIAAIVDHPARTAAQIKTSVAGKIDAGLTDG